MALAFHKIVIRWWRAEVGMWVPRGSREYELVLILTSVNRTASLLRPRGSREHELVLILTSVNRTECPQTKRKSRAHQLLVADFNVSQPHGTGERSKSVVRKCTKTLRILGTLSRQIHKPNPYRNTKQNIHMFEELVPSVLPLSK